jgi:pyruvate kinase
MTTSIIQSPRLPRHTPNQTKPKKGARRYGSEEAPPIDWLVPPSRRHNAHSDAALTEIFAYHAATMANLVHAPLLVFSRRGGMPALLSHFRPDYPIFAMCEEEEVMRHLCLCHGVMPVRLAPFPDTFDAAVDEALRELVRQGHLSKGRLVAIVQSGRAPVWRNRHTHAIQVRRVERQHLHEAGGGGGVDAAATGEGSIDDEL